MSTHCAPWSAGLPGGDTVLRGTLVVALLALLVLSLALFRNRREASRRLESYRNSTSRYVKLAEGSASPEYRVLDWDDLLVIEPNGDTRKRLVLRAEVLGDELRELRLTHGCGWPQPARHRRRVTVVARKLFAGDVPGPKMPITFSWVKNGKFILVVHFRTALPRGSEFGVLVECEWPGMCAPLMLDRNPDEFTFRFYFPIMRARYRVSLPPGVDAYSELLGFEEGDQGVAFDRSVDERGRMVFSLAATFPLLLENIGMRLEVRRGALM
ncbi:hypothetical protein [Saccharothrix sp. Mg75]|uniref:hypothetical protein n=1 Tax=Saccharothrix sp. Mg75 TaxID=3445357 RepID=UPI003EE998FA